MTVEGATPIKNLRHERFAQLIAAGLSGRAAWAEASGETITSGSAKARARLLRKRPEIQARLKFLQAETISDPDELPRLDTAETIVALLSEAMDRLAQGLDDAQARGASAPDLSRGRAVLSATVARLGRVRPPAQAPQHKPSRQPATPRFVPIVACSCGAT